MAKKGSERGHTPLSDSLRAARDDVELSIRILDDDGSAAATRIGRWARMPRMLRSEDMAFLSLSLSLCTLDLGRRERSELDWDTDRNRNTGDEKVRNRAGQSQKEELLVAISTSRSSPPRQGISHMTPVVS